MSKPINISETISLNPSGYADLSNFTTTTSYPIDNGYDGSNSDTYARLTVANGATGSVYFTFNNPNIPSSATINSISASVRARVSSTTRVTNTSAQLYSGSTAKGSSSTFASTSTTNTFNLTTGTWTLVELENIRLRIAATGASSGSGGGSSRYVYFYGATITIEYSISGTAYTISAMSNLPEFSIDPTTQDIMTNEDGTIRIDGATIEDISVTDNDIDVTAQLVQHTFEAGGTISKVASSFSTDFSDSNANFYTASSTTGTTYLQYAIGNSAESPYSTTNTNNTYVKDNNNNTATGWINYVFDFSSIPANATITSVEVKCYGARESSTTDSTHMAKIGLYTGSILKGSEQDFTSTNNELITISNPGTWTRAELENAQLRFTLAYYGGRMLGISWYVTYTVPSENPYYWTYTISNITADHVIILDTAGVYIPPEEDPEYTYQSITISSINATTTPGTGTTRIIEGSNQTITISPSDPQLTLALDNGVDITNQLVGGTPTNTYAVTTPSGADYYFNLNSSTGYYISNNDGQSNSAAIARINFEFETSCLVTISYINYAEATYDYGIFGQIDTALSTSYTADSDAYLICNTSTYNSANAQTITYTIPSGSHFIDIKYRKDSYTDSNNDSLQWKIDSIEPTEGAGDYTYTLTNIIERHSLVFVFGNVDYYFINASTSSSTCRLVPDGQQVKLSGDNYRLNIIPANVTDVIAITDNNINVSNSLEREEGYDKNNNLVVSYRYTLTNIIATHNLVVTCVAGASEFLYVKLEGEWVQVSNIYKKINGSWTKINLTYLSDENITKLRQKEVM